MNLRCPDVHAVVTTVNTHRACRHLSPVPSSPRCPERSRTWWLAPVKTKVAFPYGKAIFTTEELWVEPGSVFCGFNVEKGVFAGEAQMIKWRPAGFGTSFSH